MPGVERTQPPPSRHRPRTTDCQLVQTTPHQIAALSLPGSRKSSFLASSSYLLCPFVSIHERGYFGFEICIRGTRCQAIAAEFRRGLARRVDLFGPAVPLCLDRGSDLSAGGVSDTFYGRITDARRFGFGNLGDTFRQVRA